MSKYLEIERVTPQIVLVRAPDRKMLAEIFCRFQEHYESGFDNIRGKIFTLGQLRKAYAEGKGAWTYVRNSLVDGDWSGYNLPSYVLEPFIRGAFDPLTEQERDFVDLFRGREDKFYIIGVSKEGRPAIQHEISHGLWYTSLKYRQEAEKALSKWNQIPAFTKLLKSWGYGDPVILDEIHAYMSADYDWFREKKSEDLVKFGITLSEKLHKKLVSIKKRHFKPLDPKFKE